MQLLRPSRMTLWMNAGLTPNWKAPREVQGTVGMPTGRQICLPPRHRRRGWAQGPPFLPRAREPQAPGPTATDSNPLPALGIRFDFVCEMYKQTAPHKNGYQYTYCSGTSTCQFSPLGTS